MGNTSKYSATLSKRHKVPKVSSAASMNCTVLKFFIGKKTPGMGPTPIVHGPATKHLLQALLHNCTSQPMATNE